MRAQGVPYETLPQRTAILRARSRLGATLQPPLAAVHVARRPTGATEAWASDSSTCRSRSAPAVGPGSLRMGRAHRVRAGAHAEHLETIRAAHEYGPADSETLRTENSKACAIHALSNADLREVRSHLPVCDPARQRVFRRTTAAPAQRPHRSGWLRARVGGTRVRRPSLCRSTRRPRCAYGVPIADVPPRFHGAHTAAAWAHRCLRQKKPRQTPSHSSARRGGGLLGGVHPYARPRGWRR